LSKNEANFYVKFGRMTERNCLD